MSDRFDKLIEFSMLWEVGKDRNGKLRMDGGYVNDPDDPGGETKWGISKAAFPSLDIANLSLKQALDIYKTKYWDVYKEDKFNPIDLDKDVDEAVAVALLDTGINCGVNRAKRWFVEAQKTKDPVKTLLGLRDKHYFDLVTMKPAMQKYYKGWINRMTDLKKYVDVLRLNAHP